VKVAVGRRDDSPAKTRYFACAHFGRGGFPLRGPSVAKLHGACGVSHNPRKAIAIALRKASSKIAKRGGAFAGFAGYSRKNRRVRRSRRYSKRRG